MKLTKIKIQNFKSIDNLEFDIKKYGNSYTTMFVGINESGKSNVLEAMSFFETPTKEVKFYDYCNQKQQEEAKYVDIYFYIKFESKVYVKSLQDKIGETGKLLDFSIKKIEKNVYLENDKNQFEASYNFEINDLPKDLFIKEVNDIAGVTSYHLAKTQDEQNTYQELNEKIFKEYFEEDIINEIQKYEPKVTHWKPTEDYLISEVDLKVFSEDISSNKALKNIFLLANVEKDEEIKNKIGIINNGSQRSRLESILQDSLNTYISSVWDHKIDTVINITETGKLTLSVKDSGDKNRHDRLPINSRSEGAKHFLSLILSLSIENNKKKRKGQLILIDEPEMHLHPSGIRDLGKELLKIGEDNYVFAATHSPFLIDKKVKNRNIILKKNGNAITEKREIKGHENIIDDEVLREAFGIEVYKDLLNPHSILVEGASDKTILEKAFVKLGAVAYGITNGHGSNIDSVASKLNSDNISILVITDDDIDGHGYKEKIIKIGGCYSENNVFTIRDLAGNIINKGTIEDTLGKGYLEAQLKQLFVSTFPGEELNIRIEETTPFLKQVKDYLIREDKFSESFIGQLKTDISGNLNISSKPVLERNFPLLNELALKIKDKLDA